MEENSRRGGTGKGPLLLLVGAREGFVGRGKGESRAEGVAGRGVAGVETEEGEGW